MTIGILGQSNPLASTNTTVYTVPSSVSATCVLSVVNYGATTSTVTFAIAASSTPAVSEYLEYQTPLSPGGVLERGGLVAQTGKNFVLNCSSNTCSVSIYGFEQ
jgi:hypothetical protein